MKIAVDTNVILRIITGDDAQLLEKAKNLVKKYSSGDVFVSYAAMIEIYYVLSKFYNYPVEAIIEAFEDLMKIEQFYFEHEPAIRLALAKCKKGFGFTDALIGEIGNVKNLKTYTFDKQLKKDSSFIVLSY